MDALVVDTTHVQVFSYCFYVFFIRSLSLALQSLPNKREKYVINN